MFRISKELDDDDDARDCTGAFANSSWSQFSSVSGFVMKRPIVLSLLTMRYCRADGKKAD